MKKNLLAALTTGILMLGIAGVAKADPFAFEWYFGANPLADYEVCSAAA